MRPSIVSRCDNVYVPGTITASGDTVLGRSMSAATGTDVSLLDAYRAEWRILRDHPHNVLVEGPVAATYAIVRRLHPHVREPWISRCPDPSLDFPDGETSALIVRDVAALDADDRRRLFEWLDDAGSGMQIISTSQRPLIALVDAGLFDAALYCRLNVMLLQVGSPDATELAGDGAEGVAQRAGNRTTMSTPRLAGRHTPSMADTNTADATANRHACERDAVLASLAFTCIAAC